MRMGEDLDFIEGKYRWGAMFLHKITAVYDQDAENRACKSYYKAI